MFWLGKVTSKSRYRDRTGVGRGPPWLRRSHGRSFRRTITADSIGPAIASVTRTIGTVVLVDRGTPSAGRDSNPGPADYESAALDH